MKPAVLLLLLLTGCAAKKTTATAPARLGIPPDCQREVELKTCHPEPNHPDWCDGKYRMHYLCVKVTK